MGWFDQALVCVVFVSDLVGPSILFLLLRRWTGRWWVTAAGTAFAITFVAFGLTGGIAWLATYYRVIIQGNTTIPDEIGQSVPEYLGLTFVVCGMYRVLFAGSGFGLSLPFL